MRQIPDNASRPLSDIKGLIFNIMRFSLHDGPGIRTTVFLKGCPLNCWWCHNPESQSRCPEVMYAEERCLRCGDCVSACQHGALTFDGVPVRNADLCSQCGECAERCLCGARRFVGESITIENLIQQVRRDLVFFEESGGGVTFSGGEPLLQPEFLESALKACKAEGIHAAVDTCGFAKPEIFSRIAAIADLLLFDLKLVDPARHREFTGVSNEIILENLSIAAKAGRPVIVRIPVIPGINDDEANIAGTMEILANLGLKHLHLLPYHEVGTDKYQRLGSEYRLSGLEAPTAQKMKELSDQFSQAGFGVRIGG